MSGGHAPNIEHWGLTGTDIEALFCTVIMPIFLQIHIMACKISLDRVINTVAPEEKSAIDLLFGDQQHILKQRMDRIQYTDISHPTETHLTKQRRTTSGYFPLYISS